MKQAFVLFLLSLCLAATPLWAQSSKVSAPSPATSKPTISPDREAVARTTTDQLAAKYTLNADQAKQMYTVQVRKQRTLAQLENIRTSQPDVWRAKMKSLQKGTLASIRHLLHTKEQVDIYNNTQKETRIRQAEKRKAMMMEKASAEAIETAMLDIYAE